MTVEKIPPNGLHPQLVKKLLDNLQSNEAFRQQFQASPEQALRSLGYSDPWECMQISGGTLASPEQIQAQRSKLEDTLHVVQQFACDFGAQAGQ